VECGCDIFGEEIEYLDNFLKKQPKKVIEKI
jgi:hypothetical protein